jgi:Sulfotransferase family
MQGPEFLRIVVLALTVAVAVRVIDFHSNGRLLTMSGNVQEERYAAASLDVVLQPKTVLSSAYLRRLTKSSTGPTVEMLSSNSATNATTAVLPSATEPRDLPVRNDKGVIVFFLHIPKTGGTSIRRIFRRYGKVYFAWGRKAYDRTVREFSDKLDRWVDGDLVFFELHGGDALSYKEFAVTLREWRRKAHEKGIPFFAFTVVREPVSFAISSFAYYHTQETFGFRCVAICLSF